jgi:beta-fructofuranosidase
MHWGHAVSKDLLRWKHLPIALFPSDPRFVDESRFIGGAFSGSALNVEGKLWLIYTSHYEDKLTPNS